ncbi:MAG TPA: bile acid:sodium symporter family protein [Candidatus Hydrogenedentes bacterium]|nr:bile acid:sodium symporter family protein [Candidatus Hydrogenedentota bacterium]HOV75448.1 bile acid:sodium symporter family protein [Candidatus Hydrogenedentota bacterium]HPC17897.1 bile acid:sodium symporter family protein [Candidatus Hydrogenedentota bacterium]HRT21244.1 bile acid:sodium symporter family protein [Candidatus Hydrogenedentota bacterium]HRT65106.1 bile acid:sodium symporter family protein [Candidatus Hydrogenedentota bacterium]
MMLWVVLAGIIGFCYPPMLVFLKPHMEWLFAATMLGIGAAMNAEDFLPLIRKPHLVLFGTLAQFVIMPVLGFLIAMALRLPPELALGLILVGATPGAMASNVISYLAKTDVAYSVALTSTSTLLAPLLTPAITFALGSAYIPVPFWPMFKSIVIMVILPLLAGLALKRLFRQRIERIKPVFPAISSLFIALICGLVVALNADCLAKISVLIFAAVFLHNALGLMLGYGAGILYRFDLKRRRTLAFEVGMQNAGLGAVLALKHFSPQAALPNALFATWCIVTASILAEYWSRKTSKNDPDTLSL